MAVELNILAWIEMWESLSLSFIRALL